MKDPIENPLHELPQLLKDPEFIALVQEELHLIGETYPQFAERVIAALENGKVTHEWYVDLEEAYASLYGHATGKDAKAALQLHNENLLALKAFQPKWRKVEVTTPLDLVGDQIHEGEALPPFTEEKECTNRYLWFVYQQIMAYQKTHPRRKQQQKKKAS